MSEARGAVCICPALQTWLGEQFAKEVLASKERLQLDIPLSHWLAAATAPEIVTVLPLFGHN